MKKKILPIICSISGLELTKAEKELFSQYSVHGFILFRRNIQDADQLLKLTSTLKQLHTNQEPLIFIDQEGGRVARIKPPLASQEYPAAQVFADMYKNSPEDAIQQTKENYKFLMADLKKYNIDSPCAPVADLFFQEANKVIGDRAFGSTPEQAIALCQAAIDGITASGGVPVLKHVPGHGRATKDSHHDLPYVSTSLEELIKTDFLVFKALADRVQYFMTAHIIYDALDTELPVTISKKSIDFIRQEIGFKGEIMTDAIEMASLHGDIAKEYYMTKVVNKAVDPTEALTNLQNHNPAEDLHQKFISSLVNIAHASLEAGCDIVMHCSGNINETQSLLKSFT